MNDASLEQRAKWKREKRAKKKARRQLAIMRAKCNHVLGTGENDRLETSVRASQIDQNGEWISAGTLWDFEPIVIALCAVSTYASLRAE